MSRDSWIQARHVVRFFAALLVVGCGGGAASGRRQPATPVRVAPAARIDAPVLVTASGVVEPMQTVAVTTQVNGSLLDVLFTEGQFVRKGQPLFRIDPRPFQAAVDQARAAVTRDAAQADAARRDDARYRSLADIGYVSRSQADQMHAAAQATAATVQADRAALRAALINYGYTTIRAPIAGRTGGLLVRRGNNVSPGGGPLVVINQLSPVLVRFPVLEQDFAPMKSAVSAHPLPATAASSDSADVVEHGQLTFLDNAVDSLTGTVTGKATFPNTSARLWPGELVFLTIQLQVERGVVAVPTTAILTGQQGPYVFVVDAANTARMRQIATGFQVNDLTVVRSGLGAGERVVVDGQSRLNTGTRVAITGFGTDTGAATLGAVDSSGAVGVTGGEVVPGTAVSNPAAAGRSGGGASAATPSSGGRAGGAGATSPYVPGTPLPPLPGGTRATPPGANAATGPPAANAPAANPTAPAAQTSPLVTPPSARPPARPTTTRPPTTPQTGRPPSS